MSRSALFTSHPKSKKIFWKALACFASVCLVVSLVPTVVFADPSSDDSSTLSVNDISDNLLGDAAGAPQGDDSGIARGAVAVGGVMLTSGIATREEVFALLAEEQHIYPGEKTQDGNGNEVWTVYDTGDANTANVKATVTLPAGAGAGEKSYLYIRPVAQDEAYYPDEKALEADAGATNDVQCYAIHWVKVGEAADGWYYDLNTDSVLEDESAKATVKIEYLKEAAYLKGHQAERKLQVYNSRNAEGTELEDASVPVDVTANESSYTGFTFETNRGGPYVFVSKHLYEGFVKSTTVDKVTDGSSPFDGDDDAGNDSGSSNKVVRSYDVVEYDLTANFGARSNLSTATEGVLGFEATIEADVTEAAFDLSAMGWLENRSLEYLDAKGNVLYTQDASGNLVDNAGNKVALNQIVSDSLQGEASYTTNIASQRLRGQRKVEAEANLLSGNQTLKARIQVLGADNGSQIEPTFRAWFEGNEDNYGSESKGEGTGVQLAEKVTSNETTPDAITVSAAARFNLDLAKNSNVSHKGWFDSATGKKVSEENADAYAVGTVTVTGAQVYELLEQLARLDENREKSNPEEFTDSNGTCDAYLHGAQLGDYGQVFSNIRYGRITGYGVTLQVYNQATAGASALSKGFRGISLPQGEITFDLAIASLVSGVDGDRADQSQYYSQLWEYNENISASTGNQGKNLYWAGLSGTRYASWAAPYNEGSGESACYKGGAWTLDPNGEYHFAVSGYDFDFRSTA